jgi:branched-chain amino acid transport system permease protein
MAGGMFLFILTAGLTIIFGTLGIFNFAYGCLFMLGAYLTWSLMHLFSGLTSFWIAAGLSGLTVAVVASVLEIVLFKRIYQLDELYQILLTFGLLFVITGVTQQIWGTSAKTITIPEVISGSLSIGGMAFPVYYLFLMVFAAVLSVVLWLFLHRTRLGKAARASAMDREITESLGINVPAVFTLVFCIGSFIAALAGGMGTGMRTITLNLGIDTVLICFVVVIAGGVKSLKGTFVASLILGISDSFIGHYSQSLSMFVPYLFLALVLVMRPEGLFRR